MSEAKLLLSEDDFLLKFVYEYWLRKRRSWRGPTLAPHIKQERRDGSTNGDAYVAFRRRTEKMQTRKVSHPLPPNQNDDEEVTTQTVKKKYQFEEVNNVQIF